MARKKQRVTREGRAQIIYGLVSALDTVGAGVTMTLIARAMGLVPSTYVTNILWELFHENEISFRITELSNGGIVRMWRIRRPGEKINDETIPF